VRGFFEAVFKCYGAIRNSAVPIIAVVQGRALGFGCAIAAVADITIASDAATFQVPEMAHNILPTMVMSSFVDRIPRKAFTYLVYSTAIISAERALNFGGASRKTRGRGGAGDRRDPQGAAAGSAWCEGICASRI
jgi:enoyl-CoA hydratase